MNNHTIGDTLQVKDGHPHAGAIGELVSVNIDSGDWILDVPETGTIEVDPDALDTVQDETSTLPLDTAKECLANAFYRLHQAKTNHLNAAEAMMQRIKNDPELSALQEEIELWHAQAQQRQSEYNLAIEAAREAAIAEHLNGQPKKRYDGLIQVRKLTSVIHWDAKAALVWAQSLESPEHRAVLIKQSADKNGFQKLADILDMPETVMQMGDTYTAAIAEKDLLAHATIQAAKDTQNHTKTDEAISETNQTVVLDDVPF